MTAAPGLDGTIHAPHRLGDEADGPRPREDLGVAHRTRARGVAVAALRRITGS